jgi:pseudouridylate synthase
VVGLGTDMLPAFYSASSGLALAHRVDSAGDAATVIAAHLALPGAGGMLIVQPPPVDVALDGAEVEDWIADALARAKGEGVRGAAVTPFVLAHVAEASGGQALRANIGLIVNNARMAGAIAVALASRPSS